MSELWGSLDTESVEVSDAEKQILDERFDDLKRNPDDEQPWDEFMDGLRARL